MFSESKTTLETGLFKVPDRALITPLAEGTFALALANGLTWASRYVAGPENALLLRAIDDLFAQQPCPYNPLVLYGPPGVGKSHLAHGIARRFAEQNPIQSPLCESGSDFAHGYASAVELRSVPAWREARRTAPLLVLDDLDQLADRSAAQIEFLHTIDALLDAGSILVVTAQQSPRRIPHLLPGLVSRLSAGLTIPVARPAVAARRTMLARIAAQRELTIDDDALALLAERLDLTMPELAGALHELAAQTRAQKGARLDRGAILSYLGSRPAARQATLRDIAVHTARHYALHVADLRGPSRRQNIALARSVAMFIARRLTDKSLGAVGSYFGGRDHTTVLHGCRKTEELMARDLGLRQTVHELQATLSCY